MEQPDITYELIVAFDAAPTKRRVKAWLAAHGREDFVEGVIDGVDVAVATEDAAAAFVDEAGDATPLSLFDFDERALRSLGEALGKAFAGHATVRLNAIETRSWSEAWDAGVTAGAALETKRFLVTADEDATPTEGRIRILLSGGEAFGQGDHATTQACLETLE